MVSHRVSDLLADHVTLEIEGIDRLYLNLYQPRLQTPGGVVQFFKHERGQPVVSSALMAPLSRSLVKAIETFAKQQRIDIVRFEKGKRKDDITQQRLRDFGPTEGVLYIGVAQEKFNAFRTAKKYNPETGAAYPWLYRSTVMCNQYYFYLVDEDFGPLFIKMSSYFPYTMRVCLNGHEYAKRQLDQQAIGYQALDNGFLACDDPERLQQILDALDETKIEALVRKWLARLPHPFSAQDRQGGYRYEISVLQAEFALTQVFDRPVYGRHFFEEVIRENLDLGRPEQISLIFSRRVTKRTPGTFRTRVITDGVIPSLHVSYKRCKIKQYFKQGRALRTETTINHSYDFGIGRRLRNLPALRQIGFCANRRLLDVQRLSQDCTIGEHAFDQLTRPVVVESQRGAALRFGDPRVMALFHALSRFCLLPEGFTNATLRPHVAALLGEAPDAYGPARMSYDLRRLRMHGLIDSRPRCHRYRVTPHGVRICLFLCKAHARILRPGMCNVVAAQSKTEHKPLAIALKRVDRAIDSLVQEAKLAA
jgi:hypothetical protein